MATGYLTARMGEVYLCPTRLLAITGGFGCLSADLLLVHGADSQAWDGRYATVFGTWDGEAVQAATISVAEPPGVESRLPVPCSPPPGGWPATDSSEEAESAARELGEEVDLHPERFVGWWPGESTDSAGSTVRAMVVGTVGDVAAETKLLAEIYPYNLCVVSVQFSAADLQTVLDELASVDRHWRLGIEPSVDRVVVRATAIDSVGAEAISAFSNMVDVQVTVRPATSGG